MEQQTGTSTETPSDAAAASTDNPSILPPASQWPEDPALTVKKIDFHGRLIYETQVSPKLFYKADDLKDYPYHISHISGYDGMNLIETKDYSFLYTWKSDPDIGFIITRKNLDGSATNRLTFQIHVQEGWKILKIIKVDRKDDAILILLQKDKTYRFFLYNEDKKFSADHVDIGTDIEQIMRFELVKELEHIFLAVMYRKNSCVRVRLYKDFDNNSGSPFYKVVAVGQKRLQIFDPHLATFPEIRCSSLIFLPPLYYTVKYTPIAIQDEFFYKKAHYYLFHAGTRNKIPIPLDDFDPKVHQIAYSNVSKLVYVLSN